MKHLSILLPSWLSSKFFNRCVSFTVFFGFLWVSWDAHEPETQVKRLEQEDLYRPQTTKAAFGITKFEFYESDHNKKKMKIFAESGELFRAENYTLLEDVKIDFFTTRNNIIYATSHKGRSQLDTKDIELEGQVRIHSKEGYLMLTPKLTYLGKSHSVHTNQPVTLQGPDPRMPDLTLRGVGMDGNLNQEQFRVLHEVESLRKSPTGWFHIKSTWADFFTSENRAVFHGKVHSKKEDMVLLSETMTLYNQNNKDMALAQGKVILKSKARNGKADAILIDLSTGAITLKGKATIESGKSEIKGEQILYLPNEDRIEVDQASGRLTE